MLFIIWFHWVTVKLSLRISDSSNWKAFFIFPFKFLNPQTSKLSGRGQTAEARAFTSESEFIHFECRQSVISPCSLEIDSWLLSFLGKIFVILARFTFNGTCIQSKASSSSKNWRPIGIGTALDISMWCAFITGAAVCRTAAVFPLDPYLALQLAWSTTHHIARL